MDVFAHTLRLKIIRTAAHVLLVVGCIIPKPLHLIWIEEFWADTHTQMAIYVFGIIDIYLLLTVGRSREMAVCISIIGKDNAPLYLASTDVEKELELQYRVHAALDVVEEKCSPLTKGTLESKELYLGLLYATETHKIYGFVTNTKIKFIIVVDSGNIALRENEVRSMFRNLHVLYTDAVCNPFYTPGEMILSKKFDKAVFKIMNTST